FFRDSGVVLDAGSGLHRLMGRISTTHLDIVLSHAHLDHCMGLTFLIDVMHVHPLSRIRVFGEPEKLAAIRSHLFHPAIFPATLEVEWCDVDVQGVTRLGGRDEIAMRCFPQKHPGGSIAISLVDEAGKKVVYATDTEGDLGSGFADFAGDGDLLMHECNFSDEYADLAMKTGHTSLSRLEAVAKNCNPSKLLVTHLNPLEMAEPIDPQPLEKTLGCPVIIAEDRLEVAF
ncbi:MAG: MBL fold metallo-hydrolase, partial [Planctomycetota bacterium]